jgi:hypothetical protein
MSLDRLGERVEKINIVIINLEDELQFAENQSEADRIEKSIKLMEKRLQRAMNDFEDAGGSLM